MSFETLELSGQAAQPLELYRFVRGAVCWLYTSADEDVTYQGETYLARTISRGNFDRSDETVSSQVEVRLDRGLKIVTQFLDNSVPEPVYLWIYRLHRDSPDGITMFKGRVASASIELEEIVLSCQAPMGLDEKSIPRERILRSCPHVLYGERCRVDPDLYDHTTTVLSISSSDARQVTVSNDGGNPNGWFAAGVLTVVSTGQRMFITRHFNNTMELLQPIPGLAPSDSVTLLAGCDRTVETCRDKFNNVSEFGGFPLHPDRNPFARIIDESRYGGG